MSRVGIDADGRPVLWATDNRVAIEQNPNVSEVVDAPDPPTPPKDHRWDGSEWIEETPSGTDLSEMTDDEIAAALRSVEVSAAEALAQLVEDGRI